MPQMTVYLIKHVVYSRNVRHIFTRVFIFSGHRHQLLTFNTYK